ncbi:MAG: type II toxin-antitoxin system RelE/ParE family toxin [Acidobacteriaceae bacterium]
MDEPDRKIIPVVFYRTKAGNEPVREWLKEMTAADKKVIGSDLQTVESGWPVGMPVCRPMGNGLFEVRSNIKDGIARVLFCIHEGKMVLLHGIVKKSQKTPARDLELAIKRKRETEQ